MDESLRQAPEEIRWWTMAEAEINLRLTDQQITKLLKDGTLLGMKVGRGRGRWRIVNPGPKFLQALKEREEHVLHVPLLSTAEAAEVINITVYSLQQAVTEGRLKPANPGTKGSGSRTKMFTVAEVRRYLWKKEKNKRKGRLIVRIERVIKWAKVLLDEQRKDSAEGVAVRDELNELIQKIMALDEPQRKSSLVDLWEKIETVGYMASLAQAVSTAEDNPISAVNLPPLETVDKTNHADHEK